jgi:hypothetical protein
MPTPPSPPPTPIELFLSYSHKDEDLGDELAVHLASLRREKLVSVWHDRRIGAGEDWKGAIDEHLEQAGIILLLVSPDFMASDYCHDVEAGRALARRANGEALVIPIILRPTDWTKAPFAGLQALPKDARPVKKWPDRDEAWLDVVNGLRAAIGRLAARSPARGNAGPPVQPSPVSPPPRPATPAGGTARVPTRTYLRGLLGRVLRTDADLDAFCLDYFDDTHRRFAAGMDRVAKTNLLLQIEEPTAILGRLRDHAPKAVAKHEDWDEPE